MSLNIEYMMKNPVQCGTLLRSSLRDFISVFHEYMEGEPFDFQHFHESLIKELEDLAFLRAKKQNLCINMPPRFGKTTTLLYFIAWCYAGNAYCNFIYSAYSEILSEGMSAKIRNVISSELYRTLFGIELTKGEGAKDLWSVSVGGRQAGRFRACTIQGGVTGFGAGTLEDKRFGGAMIIDDYINASKFRSEAELQASIDAYESSFKSRKNNASMTPTLINAQRIAKNDLVGHIKETDANSFRFFKIAAMDKNGHSAWEKRISTDALNRMKEESPFVFASQYQQEPYAIGGGVVKPEWFGRYDGHECHEYRAVFFTGDTASKATDYADESACGCWGVRRDGNGLDLIDGFSGKFEIPELTRTLIAFSEKWRKGVGTNHRPPSVMFLEDKSSGIGLLQQFRTQFRIGVRGLKPEGDKYARLLQEIPTIASGQVRLPSKGLDGFVKKLITQFESFVPDDKNQKDDIVDMTVYACWVYRKIFHGV